MMAFGIVTSTQSNTCGSTDVDQYVGSNLQSKSPIIGLVKMYMQCKKKESSSNGFTRCFAFQLRFPSL